MTQAEAARLYATLPRWRWPHGALGNRATTEASERAWLREVLLDLLTSEPQGIEALTVLVHEEWGDASEAAIHRQLRELASDGCIARRPDGYVRRDA